MADFCVLGDLGENQYIVRMFLTDFVLDEVFSCDINVLRETVNKRMGSLDGEVAPVAAYSKTAVKEQIVDSSVAQPEVIQNAVIVP